MLRFALELVGRFAADEDCLLSSRARHLVSSCCARCSSLEFSSDFVFTWDSSSAISFYPREVRPRSCLVLSEHPFALSFEGLDAGLHLFNVQLQLLFYL